MKAPDFLALRLLMLCGTGFGDKCIIQNSKVCFRVSNEKIIQPVNTMTEKSGIDLQKPLFTRGNPVYEICMVFTDQAKKSIIIFEPGLIIGKHFFCLRHVGIRKRA